MVSEIGESRGADRLAKHPRVQRQLFQQPVGLDRDRRMGEVSQVSRLLGFSAWNLLGTLARIFSGILVSVALARGLGPTGMGRYGYFIWLSGTVAGLVALGLPAATRRYVAEFIGSGDRDTARAVFQRLVRMGAGLFGLASVSLIVGAHFLDNPEEWRLYGLVGVLVILVGMSSVYGAAVTGAQDFRGMALIEAVTYPLLLVFMVGALGLGFALEGVLWMYALATGLGLLLLARAARRRLGSGPAIPITDSLKRRVLRFSSSLSLILLFDVIVWQNSEIFFLRRFSATQEIAFYTIAFSLAQGIRLLASVFSSTITPTVAHLFGAGRKDEAAALFPQTIRYLGLLGVPVCLGGAAIIGSFIVAAYGEPYRPAAPLGVILFISALGPALSCAASAYLYAMERPQFNVWLAGAAALLDVLLAWSLVPSLGALGATLANVVSQTTASVGLLIYVVWTFGFRFPAHALGRIGLAGLLAAAPALISCLLLGGAMGVVIGVVAGAVAYPFGLLLFRAIESSDWEILSRIARRLPIRWQAGYMQAVTRLSRIG